jgi:hypothetical protein
VGYGPGGRFVGRIGHIYIIRGVGRGVEGKAETEGEGRRALRI